MTAPAGADALSRYTFPAADCSRIPYGMYRDPDVFELEQERIFRGPIWNYLALEAEIPNPGDYRLIEVGDTPFIVSTRRRCRLWQALSKSAGSPPTPLIPFWNGTPISLPVRSKDHWW